MLFQIEYLLYNILWLVIIGVIISLITFALVLRLETKQKALEKKYMVVLSSFIIVMLLPLFFGVMAFLLQILGDSLILLRFDNGGNNFLIKLVSISGFLLILVFNKYLIDISWEKSLWISLLTLAVLYLIFSLIPEFYQFVGFNLIWLTKRDMIISISFRLVANRLVLV